MTNEAAWQKITAEEVRPGEQIRLESGRQLTVTRIEESFMGMPNMLAFIQDTQEGWFKQPMPSSGTVEARRAT